MSLYTSKKEDQKSTATHHSNREGKEKRGRIMTLPPNHDVVVEMTPIRVRRYSNFSLDRGFVRISAIIWSPGQ